MAEIREIKIKIEATNGGSTNSNGNSTKLVNGDGTANIGAYTHPVKSSEKNLLAKSLILNQAYGIAKTDIMEGVGVAFQRYTTLKEDYMFNNTVNHVSTSVNKVMSAGNAVLAGAMTGSVGGPVGAVIGASVALAGYGVSQGFQYQARMSNFNTALNETNTNTNFNRMRAGLIDNSRGTEN